MRTSVRSHLTISPGNSETVDIDVTNTSAVIDGVTAVVEGIDPSWVRLEKTLVSLFPDESGVVRLIFTLPPDAEAGDYLIVVRVVSVVDPDQQQDHDFWLAVAPQVQLDLSLRPSDVTGGKRAKIAATVTNTGNVTSTISLTAVDPTRNVDCRVERSGFELGPKQSAIVPVRLSGPRNWFGESERRSVVITATADDVSVEKPAQFTQKPRVPQGLITIATLASIIALWAFIFIFIMNQIRASQTVHKMFASDFVGGNQQISLLAIAGRVEGQVAATSNGDEIAGLVVEANRLVNGVPMPVASVATQADGTFAIESLLPGMYTFRIAGDGFEEVWDPIDPFAIAEDDAGAEGEIADGEAAEPAAEPLRITPLANFEGDDAIDVEVTGTAGSIVGEVELPPRPPGSDPIPMMVSVRQIDAPERAEPIVEDIIDGVIDVGGLVTPGTYEVIVVGEGFAAEKFEQVLGGGETPIANTITLAAADGSISGTVSDGDGEPLGLVTVSVRSGDFLARTTTATVVTPGSYSLGALPTPNTYVLTFEVEGHESQTVALSLDPAEERTGVDAVLVGGSGTITGTTISGTEPLGGIRVEIFGENYRSETATLTTGAAAAGPGDFSITGLPVPGDYTVHISSEEFETETLSVTFDEAGTQALGAIELRAASVEVRGTVTNDGSGVGGLEVSLSDGREKRTTTSATSPAGAFAFSTVPDGSYTLEASGTGFETQVLLVTIDGTPTEPFVLEVQQEAAPTPTATPAATPTPVATATVVPEATAAAVPTATATAPAGG